MGLLVGSTARDMRTAPAISNLLFFPLMFLSGSAMPFAVLPDGVKRFARLLPTTYLVDTYSGVIVRGDALASLAGPLAVLVGVGVVGIVLTSMLFRWEGTDPIPRKSLATIAIAFTTTLGVSAAAAPAFRMGELPGTRRIDAGDARGQVLVLRGATVLDGLGGRIVNARVVIRDHRIADVSLEDDRVPLPEGAVVEDLRGRYLIPGLFDSHVHWGGSGGIGAAPVERTDDRLAHDFGAALAAGVTSVVSLTDNLADMRSLSASVAAAKQRAPRTFFAGPSITARGGHPAEMFAFLPGLAEQLTRQVETPEAARAAIAELDRAGVDLVKLVLEPGFEKRPLPRLDEDVFRAADGGSQVAKDADDRSRRHRRRRAAGDGRRRQRSRALGPRPERHDHRDDGGQAGHVHADQRRARLGMEAGRDSRRGRSRAGAGVAVDPQDAPGPGVSAGADAGRRSHQGRDGAGVRWIAGPDERAPSGPACRFSRDPMRATP